MARVQGSVQCALDYREQRQKDRDTVVLTGLKGTNGTGSKKQKYRKWRKAKVCAVIENRSPVKSTKASCKAVLKILACIFFKDSKNSLVDEIIQNITLFYIFNARFYSGIIKPP